MIVLQVRSHGLDALEKALSSMTREGRVLVKRGLETAGEMLKMEVSGGNYFRYATPTGKVKQQRRKRRKGADGAPKKRQSYKRRRSGMLQKTVWRGAAKMDLKEGSARVECGWGVRYGPVLEWGADKPSWVIRAKKAKALRFRVGDSIVYRRSVVHHWTKDQLRPHWAVALKKREDEILKIIDAAVMAANAFESGSGAAEVRAGQKARRSEGSREAWARRRSGG